MQPLLARRQDHQGRGAKAIACTTAYATWCPIESWLAEARADADARTHTQQAEDTNDGAICRARFGASIAAPDGDSASSRGG